MRIIRTDIYFSAEQVRGLNVRNSRGRNPGFAVAWFHSTDSRTADWSQVEGFVRVAPVDLQDVGSLRQFTESSDPVAPVRITRFVDLCLQNRAIIANAKYDEGALNESIVREVLTTKIIIERSPLDEIPLGDIAKQATNVTIGLYMGTHVVSTFGDPLLFITIPGGIIIAGAAIGVSRGLMNGLSTAIEKAFGKLTDKLL